MAGNTKLIGFTPGGDIVLERWGERARATVGPEGLEAIRHACIHVLPAECPQAEWDLGDVTVNYREDFGRIVIEMSPETADDFSEFLYSYRQQAGLEGGLFHLTEALDKARAEHEAYTDEKEPWVG